MFNFNGIYIFIPVSGCVGSGPVYCFARGPIILLRRPWFHELSSFCEEGFQHFLIQLSFKSNGGGHFDLQIDMKNKNFLMDN